MKFLIITLTLISLVLVLNSLEEKNFPQKSRDLKSAHRDALTVLFPAKIFSSNLNWRVESVVDPKLVELSNADNKTYVSVSDTGSKSDIYAYENWFYGVKNGVVIESGGNDGLFDAPSYLFEKLGKWTAILVEADLKNYDKMVVNRPEAINVNCALCDTPASLHYIHSNTVGGIYEFMAPNFISGWHSAYQKDPSLVAQLPQIQCVKASTLLENIGVQRVDLWILDVEGGEEAVLKGIDFKKVKVSTFIMECDNQDADKRQTKNCDFD